LRDLSQWRRLIIRILEGTLLTRLTSACDSYWLVLSLVCSCTRPALRACAPSLASLSLAQVGKALEMLLQDLITQAAGVASGRRAKTLTPAHLKSTVHADDTFDFLKSIFERVPDLESKPPVGGAGEARAPRRSAAASAGTAATVAASSSSSSLAAAASEAAANPPAKRRRGRPPAVVGGGGGAYGSGGIAATAAAECTASPTAAAAKRPRAEPLVRSGSGRGRGRGRGRGGASAAAATASAAKPPPQAAVAAHVAPPATDVAAMAAAATATAAAAALRSMALPASGGGVGGGVDAVGDGDDDDYDGEGGEEPAPNPPLPPPPPASVVTGIPPSGAALSGPPTGINAVPTSLPPLGSGGLSLSHAGVPPPYNSSVRLGGAVATAAAAPPTPMAGLTSPRGAPPDATADPMAAMYSASHRQPAGGGGASGLPPPVGLSSGRAGLPPLLGGGASTSSGSGNLGLGPGESLPSLPARGASGSLSSLPSLDRPGGGAAASPSLVGQPVGSNGGLSRHFLPPLNQPLGVAPPSDGGGLYGYGPPPLATADGGRFGGGPARGDPARYVDASRYAPPGAAGGAYTLPTAGSNGSLPGLAAPGPAGPSPLGGTGTPFWQPQHPVELPAVGAMGDAYTAADGGSGGVPRPAPAWGGGPQAPPPPGLAPLGRLGPPIGGDDGPLAPTGGGGGAAAADGFAGAGGGVLPRPPPPDGGGAGGGRGGRGTFSVRSLLN